MSEPIITKRCNKCKNIKPLSEFYKNYSHNCYCKACTKKICEEYSQSKKGGTVIKRYRQGKKFKIANHIIQKHYQNRHPEMRKAGNAVNHAVRTGKIPRPDTLKCNYCPKQAKEYHHYLSYARKHWLDVVPACVKCHNKIHANTIHINTS